MLDESFSLFSHFSQVEFPTLEKGGVEGRQEPTR
jgi:hypothetical protein